MKLGNSLPFLTLSAAVLLMRPAAVRASDAVICHPETLMVTIDADGPFNEGACGNTEAIEQIGELACEACFDEGFLVDVVECGEEPNGFIWFFCGS
jgi:hypothetical protein